MIIEKKHYERPEMQVANVELGVFGQYGSQGDDFPKPPPNLGFGTSLD